MKFLRDHRAGIGIGAALLVIAIVAGLRDRPSSLQLPDDARVRVAWEAIGRNALERRQPPLWNPYYFGGQPLIGNPEAAALYPPGLLLRLLPAESFVAFTFILHAWILGLGVVLLLRSLGESLFTATAMALATMAVAALGSSASSTSTWLSAIAWLPLVAAASLHSARREAHRPAAWLVLALAMVMLAGSTRGTWYALATAVACYVWTALWAPTSALSRRRLVWQCSVTIALAVGLTAFQNIPSWWLTWEIGRGNLQYMPASVERPHREADAHLDRLLEPIGEHRTLSACADVSAADLAAAGVPAVDGVAYYAPGYQRFASLASGAYPGKGGRYEGIPTAGSRAARADLLAWLGVEYLVACDQPDDARWQQVAGSDALGVYRSTIAPLQPVWTCPPTAMSLDEIEYELATRTYDPQLSLADRRAIVHVRWTPSLPDTRRHDVEAAHHLAPVRFLGTRTWQYALEDTSEANVRSLLADPAVEDTAHINRTLEVEGPPRPAPGDQAKSEWLIGRQPCPHQGIVTVVRTRPFRGRAVLRVDAPSAGVVVMPEPYVPGRRVWVDGKLVTPLRVNLAFVAIPVERGSHRVDLSYTPPALWVGIAVSLLSVIAWGVVLKQSPPPPPAASRN